MSQYLIFEALCPIFFSLIIAICGSNRISQILTFAVSILTIATLVPLHTELIQNEQILYEVGGYNNSIGIELKLNYFSFIFLAIFNISFLSFNLYRGEKFSYFQNILILCCVSGFNGILMSNDLFNIYVFLELLSIASYALVASFHDLKTVQAAFGYLIFGTIGAGLYLVGVAFLYMLSGTLNISELIIVLTSFTSHSSGFLWLSLFFILLGFIIKLGVFPIHNWLFKIYHDTPTKVTMLLAMTSSISSVYMLSVFIFNVYGIANITNHLKISGLLQILGIISSIVCSFLAYRAKSIKEVLVYSSLADIGYILNSIGVITNYNNKLSGSMIILQLINNLISKPILFALFSENTLKKITSKAKQSIHFFITFFLILNLIGVPPLFGFFGKFSLVTYIIQQKNWINLIFVMISVMFSCLYGIRMINNLQDSIKTSITTSENNRSYYIDMMPSSMIFLALALSTLIFSNQLQTIIDLAINNLLIRR